MSQCDWSSDVCSSDLIRRCSDDLDSTWLQSATPDRPKDRHFLNHFYSMHLFQGKTRREHTYTQAVRRRDAKHTLNCSKVRRNVTTPPQTVPSSDAMWTTNTPNCSKVRRKVNHATPNCFKVRRKIPFHMSVFKAELYKRIISDERTLTSFKFMKNGRTTET